MDLTRPARDDLCPHSRSVEHEVGRSHGNATHHIDGTVGGLIWAELREEFVGGRVHSDVGRLWVGLKLHVSIIYKCRVLCKKTQCTCVLFL